MALQFLKSMKTSDFLVSWVIMDQLPGDEVVDDSILWILSHSSDCKESYLTYDGPELYEEVYKMLQISHSLEMELLIQTRIAQLVESGDIIEKNSMGNAYSAYSISLIGVTSLFSHGID